MASATALASRYPRCPLARSLRTQAAFHFHGRALARFPAPNNGYQECQNNSRLHLLTGDKPGNLLSYFRPVSLIEIDDFVEGFGVASC